MTAPTAPLSRYPFYASRLGADGRPAPWTLSDLEDFAAQHPGDPYAGRVLDASAPRLALQIEVTGEPAVWTALGVREADRWAGILARMWNRWGAVPGDTIAFFDYGSSPLVLLTSASYAAYLRRGAADRLGLAAICNDGVASMAGRMVNIIEAVRPTMLVLRRDVVSPLAAALETAGVELRGRLRWVAVTEPEGTPSIAQSRRASDALGVQVRRVLRSDGAFLLAGDCPRCGLFHLDRAYHAEVVTAGEVAVTARFAHLCPAIRYSLGPALVAGPGCPLDPRAERVECL